MILLLNKVIFGIFWAYVCVLYIHTFTYYCMYKISKNLLPRPPNAALPFPKTRKITINQSPPSKTPQSPYPNPLPLPPFSSSPPPQQFS